MKLKSLFATLLIGLFALTSCSKDEKEEKKPEGIKIEKNLDARQEKWVYYSFEKNTIVEVADPQNSLDWDIAFFAYYAKLNGGESGKGKAGVVKVGTDFSAPVTLPKEGDYKQDTKGTMSYGNYPKLTQKEDTFSDYLSGGFDTDTGYVSLNPKNSSARGGKWPSVYAPTKFVYVIRTAKGAYAKFQVTDFYGEKGDANKLTFQYLLSEDGKF
jgi:hypothetical protein